jgi:molecular chaperone GrpE
MTSESNDTERRDTDAHEAQPHDEEATHVDIKPTSPAGAGEAEARADTVAEPESSPEHRIAELEAQVADFKDRWTRAAADLENHRRRSRRDVDDARADGTKRALGELIPVVDNLERALAHAKSAQSDEAKGIADGVTLVVRQWAQALERLGVQPVEAEGKPFDPAVHEAMSQIETNEVPPGSVAQVLQGGYRLGERLLRPALVIVAKAAPDSEESTGPNGKGPSDSGDPGERDV